MIEFCRCLNAGNNHQIKVDYTTTSGADSTAYIDHRDGHGVDKHSDQPVKLRWADDVWLERQ